MQAGSTWWKSKSGCCAGNVWIAESVRVRSLSPRSRRGSGNATRPAPVSNGSSPPKRRGTSWHVLIPTPPKSRNDCAEVLVLFLVLSLVLSSVGTRFFWPFFARLLTIDFVVKVFIHNHVRRHLRVLGRQF